MDAFEESLVYTIRFEGGYVNDYNDYGGETIAGISRAYWPDWTGWVHVDSAKNMPDFPKSLYKKQKLIDSVLEFYRYNFWDAIRGDDLAEHSKSVAAEAFDCAVNMGVTRSGRFLQESLNIFNRNGASYPELTVDGIIGPATLGAYSAFLSRDSDSLLLKAQLIQRGAFYGKRAVEDSSQERFIRGWLNRLTIDKGLSE